MKQKRTFIAVLLVVAVLALGVAFAAQTVNLSITGTAAATASAANFKVAFTNGISTVTEASTEDGQTITVSDIVAEDQAASFKVANMSTVGDKAVVTFTITNSSDSLAANLGELTVNDVDDKFTCTATYKVDQTTPETVVVEPGQTATVEVTVTLDETVTDSVAAAQVISVSFVATAQQPA